MPSTLARTVLFRRVSACLLCCTALSTSLLSGTAFGQPGAPGRTNPAGQNNRLRQDELSEVDVVSRAVLSFPLPSAREAQILQAFDGKTTVKWEETSLRDALRDLQQQHKVNIWVDLQALNDNGIDPDQPVTLEVSDVSLRSCLRLILEPLMLYPVIEDEVMKVTTIDKVKIKSVTRVYPVGDLFDTPEEATQLLDTLKCGLGLHTEAADAPALAVSAKMKTLTVRESRVVHEEIQSLLRALRDAQTAPKLDDNRRI